MSLLTALAGGVAIAVAAVLVYRDAGRVGVDAGTPALWAAFVALTAGAGLATTLLVPDAPLPGVLVLAALGPLLYALERDDSMHGDDPADPTRLPTADRTNDTDRTGDADRTNDMDGADAADDAVDDAADHADEE
ncbi:hypothetical protein [Halorubrum sp. DTA98]|uniref:hypothetical protein n=1 Tax=Halorubrum sp. DTA98 TaxID=3402163 RepID=UPI003AAD3CB1